MLLSLDKVQTVSLLLLRMWCLDYKPGESGICDDPCHGSCDDHWLGSCADQWYWSWYDHRYENCDGHCHGIVMIMVMVVEKIICHGARPGD